MASHLVTVAKATFAASLLRPDVTKVTRDEVPHFHALLEAAMLKCSPSNIQTCKQWLLRHVVPSSPRTNAFLKYLTVIATHAQSAKDAPFGTPVHRQRLHLLYLLHDLLHDAKHHSRDATLQSNITQACQKSTVELFRLAASESKPRTRQRLQDLVALWDAEQFFSRELLLQLSQTVADPTAGVVAAEASATPLGSSAQDVPYLMPASHGDATLPFYELPAGNLMPHIHPNRTISMQPDSIRPLQFSAGPADESLVNAVKDFLKDITDMDNSFQQLDDEGIVPDIDEMGQISYRNEAGDSPDGKHQPMASSAAEKNPEAGAAAAVTAAVAGVAVAVAALTSGSASAREVEVEVTLQAGARIYQEHTALDHHHHEGNRNPQVHPLASVVT